jgi:phosphate transport system substrate-binding protein
MHRLLRFSSALPLFAFLCSVAHFGNAATVTPCAVQLRGSTTLMPIVQSWAEQYMRTKPACKIVVIGGGTQRGYKAILDGTADVAMASGALPEDLAADVKRQQINLRYTTVGYEVVVPVVHPSNPLNDISIRQLKDVFSGRITQWQELNGNNLGIVPFIGPPSGGITETWKRLILGDDATYTPAGVVASSAERARQVALEPRAISFLPINEMRKQKLKPLKVNGVPANAQTIREGRFPLRGELMLVEVGKSTAAAREFVKFVERSMQSADKAPNKED